MFWGREEILWEREKITVKGDILRQVQLHIQQAIVITDFTRPFPSIPDGLSSAFFVQSSEQGITLVTTWPIS